MGRLTMEQLEQAMRALSPVERQDIHARLDCGELDLFEARIAADFLAGRLDTMIEQALDDEANGRVRPLLPA